MSCAVDFRNHLSRLMNPHSNGSWEASSSKHDAPATLQDNTTRTSTAPVRTAVEEGVLKPQPWIWIL